jgi:hypothetical protein
MSIHIDKNLSEVLASNEDFFITKSIAPVGYKHRIDSDTINKRGIMFVEVPESCAVVDEEDEVVYYHPAKVPMAFPVGITYSKVFTTTSFYLVNSKNYKKISCTYKELNTGDSFWLGKNDNLYIISGKVSGYLKGVTIRKKTTEPVQFFAEGSSKIFLIKVT